MRILGIGDWNDLGDMYLSLAAEGHEVRVYIAEQQGHDILEGLVERVDDWRGCLPWLREVGSQGVVLFETAHHGILQDELRRDGFQVIGGSAFGDRLEADRLLGQKVLREVGFQTIPSWTFIDSSRAIEFIRQHPGRYVVKYDGDANIACQTFSGRSSDGADVVALLTARGTQWPGRILMMEHVYGVEVGIGAYFNGERFLEPACLDWEHKRFFPGDIGELTGEMGTLVTYEHSSLLFERTLSRLAPTLQMGGYRGYINLNTIVNQSGIWPLEFTSRFGYPGYSILGALQRDGWSDLLQRVLDPGSSRFSFMPGYAMGVVLTVPPFPYHYGYEQLSKGTLVSFITMTDHDQKHIHLGEVAMRNGSLVCSGLIGSILVVTGLGVDAAQARADAYGRVDRVVIPNVRYRDDIGLRFIDRDQHMMRQWGYL